MDLLRRPAATGPLGDADFDGLDDAWEFRELLTYAFDGAGDEDHDGRLHGHAYRGSQVLPGAPSLISRGRPAPDHAFLTTGLFDEAKRGGAEVAERFAEKIC